MAKFDPVMYSKNVLRSAGYIGVETIKGVNPSLTNLITESIGATKEMYSTTKDFIKNPTMAIKDYIGEEAAKAAGDVKRNILDDIRTGKFYNPDRQRSDQNANMSDLLGFNFDDLDLDVDEDYGEERSEKGTPQRSIENLSITQQKLTQASTDTIVKNTNANTTRTLTQQAKMMGLLNGSLSSINTSILNLHNAIAKPLDTHIQNSTSFYKTTTELMAKQTSYLENINKLLTEQANKETSEQARMKQKKNKSTPWGDVMGNGFDMGALFGHVKNNLLERTLVNQFKDFMDPETIKMMRASGAFSSPIALISTMVLTNYLQNGPIGDALERTESIINNGITNTFMKIHDYRKRNKYKKVGKKGKIVEANKNPILGFFADLLDIVPDKGFKPNIRGNGVPYKGPTQWTGLNDKALQEVIPTQLAEIISLLSGNEPEIYNYNTGKFQRASNISKNFRKARKENINNITDDLKNNFLGDYINAKNKDGERVGFNTRYVRNIADEYNTFVSLVAMRGYNVANLSGQKLKDLARQFKNRGLISNEAVSVFNKYLFTGKYESSIRATLMNAQMSDRDFLANNGYDNTFNTIVSAGLTSNEDKWKKIKNGKVISKGKNGKLTNGIINPLLNKDDLGNDVYFYLQNYYHQLDYIIHRIEIGDIGVGKKIKSKRGRGGWNRNIISFNDYRRNNINSIKNKKEEEEQTVDELNAERARNNKFKARHSNDVWDSTENKYTKDGILETYGANKRDSDNPIANLLESFNDSLDRIFFGTNPTRDDRNYGILGPIKNISEKVSEFVVEAKNAVKDWFKKKWDEFKESDFWQRFTGQYKRTGKAAKDWATTNANIALSRLSGQDPDKCTNDAVAAINGYVSSGAAHGGMVTKSGMVSVSEGEMIIPSEMNPYYHGRTNKYTQKFNEKQNYNNWRKATGGRSRLPYWGSFAEGGKVSVGDAIRDKVEELMGTGRDLKEIITIINRMYSKKVGGKKLDFEVTKIYTGLQDAANRAGKTFKNEAKGFEDTAAVKILKQSAEVLTQNIKEPIKAYIGEKKKNAGEYGQEVMKVLNNKFPETMATGSMGALIGGALTGSGIGLLGGFVIGAGVNILKESNLVSKFLFGEFDPNSREFSGGLVPAQFVKLVKDKAPGLLKSAALGGVIGSLGILPGGIIGGATLATTLQVLYDVKTIRGTLQTALFGEEGVDGKRRGGIIGSIQIRIIDPIADYVKDKLDNFGDYFKENFVKPVLKIFRPMSNWISGKGIKVLEGVGHALQKAADDTFTSLGRVFDSTIGKALGLGINAGKKILDKAGQIATLPFSAVGKAADAWEIHNINAGYSTRSAKERVEKMKKAGKETSKYNKLLAQLQESGDTAGAEKLTLDTDFYARGLDSTKGDAEKHRRETKNKIIASLTSGGQGKEGYKLGNKIDKLMKGESATAGDFTEVINYLNTLSPEQMSDSNKKLVQELLGDESKYIKYHNKRVANYNKNRSDFFKRVYGIDISANATDKQAEKILAKYGLKDQAYTDRRAIDKETTDKYYGKIKKSNALEQLRAESPLEGDTNREIHTISDLLKKIDEYINPKKEENTTKKTAKELYNDAYKEARAEGKSPAEAKIAAMAGTRGTKKYKNIYNSFIASGMDKDEAERMTMETLGESKDEPVQPKENNKKYENGMLWEFRSGKWKPDMSDTDTKNTINEKRKEKEENKKFRNGILSIIPGLSLFFGGKKNKDGEKKETFWDKIKGFLGPVGGILGGIGSAISTVGSVISSGASIFSSAVTTLTSFLSPIATFLKPIAAGIGGITSALVSLGLIKSGIDTITSFIDSIRNHGKEGIGSIIKHGWDSADAAEAARNGFDRVHYGEDEWQDDYTAKRTFKKGMTQAVLTSAATRMGRAFIDPEFTSRVLPGIGGKLYTAAGNVVTGIPGAAVKTGKTALGIAKKAGGVVMKPLAPIGNGIKNIGSAAKNVIFGSKVSITDTAAYKDIFQSLVESGASQNADDVAEMALSALGANADDMVTKPGLLTGVANLAGKAGGAVKNTVGKIGGAMGNTKVGQMSGKAFTWLTGGIKAILGKAGEILSKVFGKPAGMLTDLADDIVKAVSTALGSTGAKKLAGAALKALPYVTIALAIENGWEDAQSIIGLLREPTAGERLISALASGISELVFGLLTPDFLVDKLLWVGELLGLDVGNLQADRQAAKDEMAQHNEDVKNGLKEGQTYNTTREYLKNTKGLYTTQDKIKKTVGGAVKAVGDVVMPGLKKAGTAVLDAGKKAGSAVWGGMKQVGSSLYDGGARIMGAIGGGVQNIAETIGETLEPAMNKIKGFLDKINTGMPYVKESVKAIGNVMQRVSADFHDPEKGLKDIIAEDVKLSSKNPLAGITKAVAGGVKIIQVPMMLLGATFGKVWRSVLSPALDAIVPAITRSITGVTTDIAYAIKGDPKGIIDNMWGTTEAPTGNAITDVLSSGVPLGLALVAKPPILLASTLSWGIRKVASFAGPIAQGIGDGVGGAVQTVKNMFSYVTKGDIKGLLLAGSEGIQGAITGENTEGMNGIGAITAAATGALLTPMKGILILPTALAGIFNFLKDKFISSTGVNLDKMIEELNEYGDPKKQSSMDGYDKVVARYQDQVDKDGIAGLGSKLAISLVGFVNKIPVTISRAIKNAFGIFDGGFTAFKNWLLGVNQDDKGGSSGVELSKPKAHAASNISSDYTMVTDNSTINYDDEMGYSNYGFGSGIHVRQEGRERYGGSTLGDVGCGPAAAATVLRAYGKHANLRSAAKYARNRGYEVGGASGTKAGYFNDVFAANGIRSNYVTGSNISNAVSSGKPTVLLGQDKSNNSKANSPFGPYPHYVVANGTDKHGNVFIDDPELKTTALYKKDILKNTSLGIATGGKSGAWSSSVDDNVKSNAEAETINLNDPNLTKEQREKGIWSFLRSKGLNEHATAGIMGNFQQESSNNPKTVEGNWRQGYPGDDVVLRDEASLDNYTRTFLKKGDKSYYCDKTNGLCYPGIGLAQWTGPRARLMIENSKQTGKDWRGLEHQLNWFYDQEPNNSFITNRRAKTLMDNADNAEQAAVDFLDTFEHGGSQGWHNTVSDSTSGASNRKKYAAEFYTKFTGQPLSTIGGSAPPASFPKYQLSDQQLAGLANILQHEQPTTVGRYAEASLMANLTDRWSDSDATAAKLVNKATGGWFAHGADRYAAGRDGKVTIDSNALKAAEDVFVKGYRTVPRYVDEHDCFSDIGSISTGSNVKDRSAYKAHETVVKNKMGSTYTFYKFPDDKSDPFGYIHQKLRDQYGEGHYDVDESGNVTSDNISIDSNNNGFTNSGVYTSNTSKSNDIGSIISRFFSTIFKGVVDAVSGPAKGILKTIFGINDEVQQTTQENQGTDTTKVGVQDSSFGSTNAVTSKANDFPYYNQGDAPWGDKSYVYDTYRNSACGPTSMAMVMKSYGINVNPEDTGTYAAQHGHRIEGQGTGWGFFKDIGNANGLTVNEFDPNNERVINDLKQGIPVISSQRAGHFTKRGHYIVLSGIDSNGNIYVNDPSSRERSSHAWTSSNVLSTGKQYWEISKDGKGSIGHITPTEPSTVGSRQGGRSGLPIYDFTGGASGAMDMMHASNRLQQSIVNNTATTKQSTNTMDYNEIYNNMLKLLAQIAANTANNTYLPTIVELIKELGSIMGTMNNSGGTTTVVAEDKRNQINQDLSRIMAKIDEMTMSL